MINQALIEQIHALARGGNGETCTRYKRNAFVCPLLMASIPV
jgi:hypothetical protein